MSMRSEGIAAAGRSMRGIGLGVALVAVVMVLTPGAVRPAAGGPVVQEEDDNRSGFPDLVGALKRVEGCLGVETANTGSGKNVIFAWFENREACLRWYYSDLHQALMNRFFPGDGEEGRRKPLRGVDPDYDGPILAVASITYTDGQGAFEGVPLPISQIAIELYQPLSGGLSIGGRFAPDAMKIPGREAKAYEGEER